MGGFMWFFKKKEVDVVTIPDSVWAKNIAEEVSRDRESKETKELLKRLGQWIKNKAKDGEVSISLDSWYFEDNYKTPRWILYDNVKNALSPYGYEVSKGTNLNYYLNITWGEIPKCPDLKPVTVKMPMSKKGVGG